jgi:DNA-binding MarR family transcriptional regulator
MKTPKVELPLGPSLDFLQRLWELDHALERLSSSMSRRIGVTAHQRLVVRCVGRFPGMTAGQLAGLLHLDPGTISAALNRLEEKGLVERKKDPRDKRRVSLGLTTAGRALDKTTRGTVESAVTQLLATSSEADIEITRRILADLTTILGAEAALE